ncbi:mechanosensitive ion channel family protein [Pseudodesulfovibrio sediminis]|uniref:Mechanosensitive ion channel protein MscS n=1 Tax=Pseudodesulfovibrio sediminis TaxID=2810563 RepID=A0ABM7PA76_9BACT|nr:mechanosensitive ion channel domain-containing protein [Pseudodesulfovibrio sediminis]BCS89998.1 mechanosensitive ion channel protein MscS [Pseudodesulfovibrio sediminis]
MLNRVFIFAMVVALACCLSGAPSAHAAASAAVLQAAGSSHSSSKSDTSVAIPSDSTPEQISAIMAGLSDEQVRRLLLEELKKNAEMEKKPAAPTGLEGVLASLRSDANFVRDRFQYLFSGASTAPRDVPRAFSHFLAGDDNMGPGMLLLALVALSVFWVGGTFLFKRRTVHFRKAIARTPGELPWYEQMGRLFLRAVLDIFGVVLVGGVAFACYLVIFDKGAGSKIVIIAWLLAMIFLALVKISARFLLAPHAPSLRYLPLTDATAQYMFRWVVNIARILALSMLVNTILRLHGSGEAVNLLVMTFFGFVVAFVLTLLVLWNKKPIADAIRRNTEADGLVHQFADSWHAAAMLYIFGSWMLWVFAIMLFGAQARLIGIMTLLLVPGYLLVEWATQRLVDFAVDMAGTRMPTDEEEGDELPQGLIRFQKFLRNGFHVLVLAATVFLFLRIWGINLQFGREVVRAAISILLTLILAYMLWVYVNRFIERKLMEKQEEQSSGSGEGDGGGPGGDRFSTLLQLVKKFIFVGIAAVTVLVMLSSLGVDIGPLIAGASIFGIAIGFGAQTLVKDIISGIFFLTDDAFRVGDYIETSGAMGTVEEISVRSLKLRHHLGFLYTIPFGSMKMIKNNTRDWAVMKLQYLVPFDTDIGQVKKIIKKINKEVRAVPELNEVMLGDIKSQGVKAMEEYGMRMRVKFMTKPGGQFTLRKLVLAKMRKHFAEAGIEFAKPRVAVQIPDSSNMTDEDRAHVAAAAGKTVEDKQKAKKAASHDKSK